MLSYIITFFLGYFLGWCSGICISVGEWQWGAGKGCRVWEAVQFSGKNTGPEIVLPLYLKHTGCLWVNHRRVPWLILLMEIRHSNCWPCQVSRALWEQNGMWVQNCYIGMAEIADYCSIFELWILSGTKEVSFWKQQSFFFLRLWTNTLGLPLLPGWLPIPGSDTADRAGDALLVGVLLAQKKSWPEWEWGGVIFQWGMRGFYFFKTKRVDWW